jgi:branched-chain amino acid transport system permease protein
MITRLGASQLYLVGYAAVFMVVLLLLPRGVLPSLRSGIDALRERRRTHRPRIAPEEPRTA